MRNRIALLLAGMLILGLLAGVMTSAAGGAADPTAAAAKKKCKKGFVRKHGKCKKRKAPQPPPPPPTPSGARLTIDPPSLTFPSIQHGTMGAPLVFTATNVGTSASGTPAVSITQVTHPVGGPFAPPGFGVTDNACTASLPPAGNCTVNVRFQPISSGSYASVLHVTAGIGGDAQAQLFGQTSD